jgi:hypothetical protein
MLTEIYVGYEGKAYTEQSTTTMGLQTWWQRQKPQTIQHVLCHITDSKLKVRIILSESKTV